jgi:hypothetical protein
MTARVRASRRAGRLDLSFLGVGAWLGRKPRFPVLLAAVLASTLSKVLAAEPPAAPPPLVPCDEAASIPGNSSASAMNGSAAGVGNGSDSARHWHCQPRAPPALPASVLPALPAAPSPALPASPVAPPAAPPPFSPCHDTFVSDQPWLVDKRVNNYMSFTADNCSFFEADPSSCTLYKWIHADPSVVCCACSGGTFDQPPPPFPYAPPQPPSPPSPQRHPLSC